MENIVSIARKVNINSDNLELYGKYTAKIRYEKIDGDGKGKLILVTAMTPTRFGEGKTTMSIGLADALSILGKKTILCLREPSLGPVFSQKGGAAGGGLALVEPSQEINLHFTGDIHAITSVHNLIAAEIDNHIFWGNELDIQEIYWKRAIDLCDRNLRKDFMITAASEIMAVFCLAKNPDDLKKRLESIIIGKTSNDLPVKVSDLKIIGELTILLEKALLPNLVQTGEGTPAIIHGGPFANIAHGTNSLIATRTALRLADFVVTEAGFGSDLGGFKYFDIITRTGGIKVDSVVIVSTCRAVKECGIENIGQHIAIMRKNGIDPIIAINRFNDDTEEEIENIKTFCHGLGIVAVASEAFASGGKGSLDLADKVLEIIDAPKEIRYIYNLHDPIREKIAKANQEIFGGSDVEFSDTALAKMDLFTRWGYGNLPICIAKTQYSLSDDKSRPKILEGFTLKVTDLRLSSGAGFVVAYCGNILTMPGMPKKF